MAGSERAKGSREMLFAGLAALAILAVGSAVALWLAMPGGDSAILAPGSVARVAADGFLAEDGRPGVRPAKAGYRLIVLDDPGPAAAGLRRVRVRVMDGPDEGRAMVARRFEIRPAR